MMKKILTLMFLAIALNANLYAIEKKQVQENAKSQLTKIDKAKIVAASLGCAFFGWSAVMTYPTMITRADATNWKNEPTSYMSGLFYKGMNKLCQASSSLVDKAFILQGITSGSIACGFGVYIYKKLSNLRSNKSVQEKNNF